MSFSVSINPLYQCNFRCPFCYLTLNQLKEHTRLKIADLRQRLIEISIYKKITHVDLYGGELTILPEPYVLAMIEVIRDFYEGPISVITNLSRTPKWLDREDIDISVSWDFTEREQYERVIENMIGLNKPFHVLMLASSGMINWSDDRISSAVNIFNTLAKVSSVEIKPYSTNQASNDDVSFTDYEQFIKRWIELSPENSRSYEFVTENNIKNVLAGNGHAWSDDHIYIAPSGKFAVLDFDINDREFFLPVHNFEEYLEWTLCETLMVNSNVCCRVCEFRGKCLSEHLRVTTNVDINSCSGFKGLLEWYRNTK